MHTYVLQFVQDIIDARVLLWGVASVGILLGTIGGFKSFVHQSSQWQFGLWIVAVLFISYCWMTRHWPFRILLDCLLVFHLHFSVTAFIRTDHKKERLLALMMWVFALIGIKRYAPAVATPRWRVVK